MSFKLEFDKVHFADCLVDFHKCWQGAGVLVNNVYPRFLLGQ